MHHDASTNIPVVYSPHPLREVDRKHTTAIYQEGETYAALIERVGIQLEEGFEVRVNGGALTAIELATRLVQPTDFVTITKAVENAKTFNIIFSIALIAYGFYTGNYKLVAVGVGGLLNATIFAPTIPKLQDRQSSPTYSVSGAKNQSRIGQPAPVVYGVHKVVPDYGAAPYVEYIGEDQQWLYQVFNFGFSDIALSDIKIGNTPIDDFDDVKYEISGPDGKLTLFPGNVDTAAVATALEYNTAATRTTSLNTTKITLDFDALLYRQNKKSGKFHMETCVLKIELRKVGDVAWTPFSHESTYRVYNLDQLSGAELWETADGTEVVGIGISSDDPEKLKRVSIARDVEEGQYEVRITRLTQNISVTHGDVKDNSNHKAEVSWSLMKSYQPDEADYTGQTRLAVAIRASGQLNGVIGELSAIATASIPVWDSDEEEWVTEPSSNPAWCSLHFARGKTDEDGVKIYGGGLPDTRLDLDKLTEWAAFCDANDLAFNGVFDQHQTVAETLEVIARPGRASLSWASGKLGVVYDKPSQSPIQLFGMNNIRAGSFGVDYPSGDIADEIRIGFINPDLGWMPDTVSALMPGVTVPKTSVEYSVFGITSEEQAGREANLQAAAQLYHGPRIYWETDMEGLVCARGDVVLLSHDLTSWSYSGRLEAGATATVLKLSAQVRFTAATTPYVTVRHPNGTIETKPVTTQVNGTVTDTITLSSPLAANPSTDTDNAARDYTFQFDPATTPGRKVKITSLEPISDNHVKITAREEVQAYYDAVDGDYTYVPPVLLNVGSPSISNIQVSEQLVDPDRETVRVSVTWDIFNAESVNVRVAGDGEQFTNLGRVDARSISFLWYVPETIIIELAPISPVRLLVTPGVETVTYTIRGLAGLPEDSYSQMPRVNGLQLQGTDPLTSTFTGKDANFTWRKVAAGANEVGTEPQGADAGGEDPYFKDYEVRVLNVDNVVRRVEYVKDNAYVYSLEKNVEDGFVAREFTIEVRARGTQGQLSYYPARMTVSNPAPAEIAGLSLANTVRTAFVSYSRPDDLDFAGVQAWLSDESGFTPGPATSVGTEVGNTIIIGDLTPNTIYYLRVAGYDAFGQTGLNISSELTFTTTSVQVGDLSAGVLALIESGDLDVSEILDDLQDQIDTETATRAADIAAEAASRVSGDGTLAASISSEASTRASADSALSSSLTTLGTTVSGNTAAIASEVSTRSSADSALAADISTLNTTVGGHTSSITTINGTLSSHTGSIATINTTLSSHSDAIDDLDDTSATHTSQISTITSDVSSLSTSLTTLSSTVGGHTTTLSTQASTIDGIEAKYTVKINNDGYISGYGLISTANNGVPTSEFTVLADKFSVWSGSGATIINPFTVSGGTVYLTNAVANNLAANLVTATHLQAGSVTASKISVSTLSAISADLGAITAGSITMPSGGFIKSGQTAYNTGTGFYLGNDSGSPKFSVGNPSGSYLKYDSGAGTLELNADFIQAGNIKTFVPESWIGINAPPSNNFIYYIKLGKIVGLMFPEMNPTVASSSTNFGFVIPDSHSFLWTGATLNDACSGQYLRANDSGTYMAAFYIQTDTMYFSKFAAATTPTSTEIRSFMRGALNTAGTWSSAAATRYIFPGQMMWYRCA